MWGLWGEVLIDLRGGPKPELEPELEIILENASCNSACNQDKTGSDWGEVESHCQFLSIPPPVLIYL